jgi:Flp pilus assembly protein TadG
MKYQRINRKQRGHSANRRRGTGLVEFALCAPLLIFILLGIIDFGLLARNQLMISNAARDGARAASLGQSTANIRTRILNGAVPPLRVNSTGVIENGSIVMQQATVPSSGDANYTSTPWPADIAGKNGVVIGNYVRITVNYTHLSMTRLFNRPVSISVVMRREA